MEETIEKMVLKVFEKVSDLEKARNKALERRAAKLMKAVEYMKAVTKIKNLGA